MKKSIFLFTLFLLCITPLLSETTAKQPSNFDEPTAGTHFNPYLITNLSNLRWLSETASVWGSQNNKFFFKQTADIDASETESWNNGQGFIAIGNSSNFFSGIYDGDNHTIYNLYSNASGITNFTGLFGVISYATIKNVHIRDASIIALGVAGILVCAAEYSYIRWCSVSGKLRLVENYYSMESGIGGLLGVALFTDIYHCYSLASITSANSMFVGGLIGRLLFDSFLRFCYFNGSIYSEISSTSLGGIVGQATEAEIRNVFATTSSPLQEDVAGIIGNAQTWTTVFDAHWDTETTMQTNGVTYVFSTSMVEATGLSTAEMKNETSYTSGHGWDFINTWVIDNDINEGYPTLRPNISEKPSNYYSHNSGSEENPFLISNLFNLRWLSEAREFWGSANEQFHFLQTQDIDAFPTRQWNGTEGFIPIGLKRQSTGLIPLSLLQFSGVYDGRNHKISNLNIKQRPLPYYDLGIALFGYTNNAVIKNLSLVSVDMKGSWGVAAIANDAQNSLILNCSSSGFLTNMPYISVPFVGRYTGGIGGLVYRVSGTTIEESYSTVTILDSYSNGCGGLADILRGSHIKNSFFNGIINTANPSIPSYSGGLTSVLENGSSIVNSYVTSREEFVNFSALVWRITNSSISNSYWDSQTTGVREAFAVSQGGSLIGVQGYTTEQMNDQESYVGWNFNEIWDIQSDINTGYPFLSGLPIPVMLLSVVNLEAEVNENDVVLMWEIDNSNMIAYARHHYDYNQRGTFIGFEVYRDNVLLTNTPISDLTFTDSGIEKGSYSYGVVVVYEEGKSGVIEIEVIVGSFSVPNAVVLLSPEDEAIDVELKPVFNWVLPSDGGEVEGLRFYLNSEPLMLPADTTEYTLEIELDYETTYYWQVVAFNEFGDSVDNQVFSFTTKEPVSDKDENALPLVTELLGNYPNPFNPETTIKFSLNKESYVRLDVYNIRGQKVKTLFDDLMRSGEHQVIWNGTDENGLSVGSGVYFYRMVADDYIETKRMLLLK